MNTQLLIQLLVNGLVVGTLYGVVAMSFVLIYKATQVVNFAQGELLLVGAWVCWCSCSASPSRSSSCAR
jgi:branched-chain amino acid transport system permease protein